MPSETQNRPDSLIHRLWARVRCLRGLHAPDRTRVRKNGLYYTGKCETCGIPIRKRHGSEWKPYKP